MRRLKNSDRRERELERQALASGAFQDMLTLVAFRARQGKLSRARIERAAELGHNVALELAPGAELEDYGAWVESMTPPEEGESNTVADVLVAAAKLIAPRSKAKQKRAIYCLAGASVHAQREPYVELMRQAGNQGELAALAALDRISEWTCQSHRVSKKDAKQLRQDLIKEKARWLRAPSNGAAWPFTRAVEFLLLSVPKMTKDSVSRVAYVASLCMSWAWEVPTYTTWTTPGFIYGLGPHKEVMEDVATFQGVLLGHILLFGPEGVVR